MDARDQEPLYGLSSSIWGIAVPVCWETAGFDAEKGWVRAAIERTWMQESGATLTGWGQCASGVFAPLRIRIEDNGEAPHTHGLGTQLSFLAGGMSLNFTFASWSPGCAVTEPTRRSCIESIAVHEFGHALGFSHEQNRPDTPKDCTDAPQGTNGDTMVGAWDLSSTMNYCNPTWNNGGILSEGDILGARVFYGFRGWADPTQWCYSSNARLLTGDFNGDGRTDLLCHAVSDGYKWIALADANGRFNGTSWESGMHWCYTSAGQVLTGDFNGDGRSDLLCHQVGTGHYWVSIADTQGHFSGTSWEGELAVGSVAVGGLSFCADSNAELVIGDFDGDGAADLMCHYINNGHIRIAYSNGPGTFTGFGRRFWETAQLWCSTQSVLTGDFNGDGRTDLLCHDQGSGETWITLATPRGTVGETTWKSPLQWCYSSGAVLITGDFNGDGRSDLLCHQSDGYKWFDFADANGEFYGTDWQGLYGHWCKGAKPIVGAFDSTRGDDLLCQDMGNGHKWLSYTRF